MKMRSVLFSMAALFAASMPAQAAQLVLTPGNVIASSGSYSNGATLNPGDFPADRIFDQQTGNVIDNHAYEVPDGVSYWLNGNGGPANAFITIDLGAVYSLSSFDFFNTHNAEYFDRGTGNFSLIGSNSLSFGSSITFASGTLTAAPVSASWTDPIAAQTFASQSNTGVRYLRFLPTSVAASAGACCGSETDRLTVYGLNELRIFGSAVPEPASWAMMILGFGLVGGAMRRRAKPAFATA